ncbi:hypothetical protein [Helicobacter pullorum]|uniref:hypothetical protein n=1 Tax=Helicobacter pullorum TaxID=35818 RepID=UPI0008168651|nr:hypothetical protein [Helicobacter pullorum]OCR08013.1 hypothetical protein A7X13_08170 [Helicobacter pullorum]
MKSSSKSKKEIFLKQDNIELIQEQIKEFCELYKEKYQIQLIKGKYVKEALIKTIRHYNSFLKEFSFVLESVDFYRTYAWFGYFLALEFSHKDSRFRALNVTCFRIFKEIETTKGFYCNDDIKKEVLKFLQYELQEKESLGIGKNGLYILGKLASTIEYEK